MLSGDIIYATLVVFAAAGAYKLARSRTTSLLPKIIVVGGALALLQGFDQRYGWWFDAAHDWLWQVVTPDRALIAGLAAAIALMLRDRYVPMVSAAGYVMRRLRSSADAEVQRKWREAEAAIRRQERVARERLSAEERATRSRMAVEVRSAQAFIAQELEKLCQAREAAANEKERAAQPDPYKVLGVSPGANREEIKRRYRELVTAYHPDKAGMATPEIRCLAEDKMKEINNAYDELRDCQEFRVRAG